MKGARDVLKQNKFAIQLIAKGSFVDSGVGNGCSYLVEAFTIRLNHIALNAWILSEMMNSRDCYSTDKEWEAHKVEYKTKRKAVHDQILKILDINPDTEGISITQAQSEVFTVVHISELKLTGEENLPLTLEELKEKKQNIKNRQWVWIEILPEHYVHNLRSTAKSAYYQVHLDYTEGKAFCCGYPGLGFYFKYEDYSRTWLAFSIKPEKQVQTI